jgi:hypothetical protein
MFSRLEIVGPSSVAPGEEVQFTAIGHTSSGTTEDVTQRANWQSSRTSVFTVTSGRVRGVGVGEAVLRALFSAAASREIVIVPTGTFRVAGQVIEGDSPSTPVVGASVVASGISATTAFDGRYRLYGVSGPAQIRAEKAGYQPVTQTVSVNDHSSVNFVLPLSAPRLHVSGGYTLTFTAAADCRERLPEEAWVRRYAAIVHQQGPLLRVTLSGATFVRSGTLGDSFSGRVEPSRVVFTLNGFFSYGSYGYYGDVTEEIGPSSYYTIGGTATAAGTSDLLEGPLNGAVAMLNTDPRRFPRPTIECRSQQHRFRLSR